MPPLPDKPVDVVYLCYPNNPTGTVLTKAQLKVFVDWAKENGAIIIYDAAYRAYVTNPEIPLSIYEVEGARGCGHRMQLLQQDSRVYGHPLRIYGGAP